MGATRAILETLRVGGTALIYVWALEQKASRRGWDKGDEQDVMVPWVMKSREKKTKKVEGGESGAEKDGEGDKTFHRYYHLYQAGELEEDIANAGGAVVESGYEKDNWWAIATRRDDAPPALG